MEDDSKYQNWNIAATTVWIVKYEFLGGELEENSEEISSVALLSPACLTNFTTMFTTMFTKTFTDNVRKEHSFAFLINLLQCSPQHRKESLQMASGYVAGFETKLACL
jgi:hypothetical protein